MSANQSIKNHDKWRRGTSEHMPGPSKAMPARETVAA
ncbi:hypothetical protein J2W34_004829 [Variovorax boronicumulans]|nr:hypothetical protein [Variovorax boronicumulans]